MKVRRPGYTVHGLFKPYTIEITIESDVEEAMLRRLVGYNMSIPAMLSNKDDFFHYLAKWTPGTPAHGDACKSLFKGISGLISDVRRERRGVS